MRMRLVGYTGERPPIPGVTPVDPIDPGPEPIPDPSTIPDPITVVLNNGDIFRKIDYLNLGYNRFDVMCIGGGGGRGGGYLQTRGDGIRQGWGGAGGGGGVHRVKGRLVLLPAECPVIVGAHGADGVYNYVSDPNANPYIGMTNGGDGGATSFGGTICRASGGKGGSAVPSSGPSAGSVGGLGGNGGIGNSIVAGGGAIGGGGQSIGYARGVDGLWDGTIGSGGGGGMGGLFMSPDQPYVMGDTWSEQLFRSVSAGAGGKGSYLSTESTVSAPGSIALSVHKDYLDPRIDGSGNRYYIPSSGDFPDIPGVGGGGRTFPIDGSLAEWGSGGIQGFCVIRLTYVIA